MILAPDTGYFGGLAAMPPALRARLEGIAFQFDTDHERRNPDPR